MKKIVFLALLAIGLIATQQASAQVTSLTGTSGLALDTITNADATSFKTGKVSGKHLYLIVKFTKISGTVAGTVTWEGSLDNTVFAPIAVDTLTDTSANWEYHFAKESTALATSQYLYHRVTVATTGTSSASVSVKILSTN